MTHDHIPQEWHDDEHAHGFSTPPRILFRLDLMHGEAGVEDDDFESTYDHFATGSESMPTSMSTEDLDEGLRGLVRELEKRDYGTISRMDSARPKDFDEAAARAAIHEMLLVPTPTNSCAVRDRLTTDDCDEIYPKGLASTKRIDLGRYAEPMKRMPQPDDEADAEMDALLEAIEEDGKPSAAALVKMAKEARQENEAEQLAAAAKSKRKRYSSSRKHRNTLTKKEKKELRKSKRSKRGSGKSLSDNEDGESSRRRRNIIVTSLYDSAGSGSSIDSYSSSSSLSTSSSSLSSSSDGDSFIESEGLVIRRKAAKKQERRKRKEDKHCIVC